jgi:hypothetical protein
MNCLEFRRRTTIDPLADDADLMAHEAECPGCASYAREMRAQEIALRAALKDITPPAGLAERVVLATRYEQQAEHRRRWWYGAAASLLLVVGVSMVTVFQNAHHRGQQDLVQSVLQHISDEAHHLHEVSAVSRGRLHWVFERFGARLVEDIGRVNFAAECLMRHRNGVHLVLPGRLGPITVFFMPGEMTDGALPVSSEQMAGRIVPTAWGSIAVVGEIGEELNGLGERLAGAVEWPSTAVTGTPIIGQRGITGRLIATQQKDG